MRTLSLCLAGLVAITGCKTAHFKGDTASKATSNPNSTDGTENPVGTGTTNGTSVVTTNPDGTTTTTTTATDGTTTAVTKNTDGTTETVTKKPDGTVITATTKPDGTIDTSSKNPDGSTTTSNTTTAGTTTSTTTKPDGTKVDETKTKDGTTTTTTTKPDGTVTTDTKKPDGTETVTTKTPNGSTTTSTTTPNKDGSTTTVTKNPDGSTTTTTTTTKPDGTTTVVTKNPDGTTTTVVKEPTGGGTKGGTKGTSTDTFVNCPEYPDRMLVAGLYILPKDQPNIPDYKKMKKQKDVCLKQLDVIDHDFKEGFPGIPNLVEWFGLDINWRVNVPEDGTYTFTLNSDDGSFLYIDGKQVINNDGLHEHEEKSGKATLGKGWHTFRVTYYQGPRYRIALELFWKRPGASKREYIPTALFARPSN